MHFLNIVYKLLSMTQRTLWEQRTHNCDFHTVRHLISAAGQQKKKKPWKLWPLFLKLKSSFVLFIYFFLAMSSTANICMADLSLLCSKVGQCLISQPSQSESSALCASIQYEALERGTKSQSVDIISLNYRLEKHSRAQTSSKQLIFLHILGQK